MKKATLALACGETFEGFACGAAGEAQGEVVFNTSHTGYQEILTDPSYAGQLVTFTVAELGNYGIHHGDARLRGIQRGDDALELRLGEEPERARLQSKAPRAERDLLGGFLAGDIERGQRSGYGVQRLQEQSRLADAGIAAEQRDLPADEAAAERAVELGQAARNALQLAGVYRFERDGLDGNERSARGNR